MNITGWLHRLRVLIAPEKYGREVAREIQFHLDLEAMHQRHSGLSERQSREAARQQFGNVTYSREEVRRMTPMHIIDRFRQNASYAIRGLSNSPAFTLGVVLTLGLGLGVNGAMFDFLDRVFVRAPAAVVKFGEVRRFYVVGDQSGLNSARDFMTYPHINAIVRSVDTSFKLGIFTRKKDTTTVTSGARQFVLQRSFANAAFFSTLGVKLALGRPFDAQEDRIDVAAPVAIISYDVWQRAFNSEAGIIGTAVRVANRPITIIGVAEKGFSGIDLDRVDFWMPAGDYDGGVPRKTPWYNSYRSEFGFVARFAAGKNADALAERRFVAGAQHAYRDTRIEGWGQDSLKLIQSGPIISALGPAENGQEVSIALRLGGVSFIVLLIALANVSNLLMVRASKRGREIAVRRALGAGRGRLFEQFITESVLLALVSLAVSVALAFWVGSAMRSLLLPNIAWAGTVFDARSALLAIGVTLVVGVMIGLAPAMHIWRPDLISSLRAGSTGKGYRKSPVTSALVIAQAALSVILLVGAGLFVRSLNQVHAIDVGYDVNRIIVVQPLSTEGGPVPSLTELMPDLLRRLSAIPGVELAASASVPPMSGGRFAPFQLPDRDKLPVVGGEASPAQLEVSPEFFRAAGMRIVSGRVFTASERTGVVVGEAMAKAYWPGKSPLGQCVILDLKTRDCVPVIGVVADVNRFRIIERERIARYYISGDGPQRVAVLRVAPEKQNAILAQMDAEVRAVLPQAGVVRTRSLATIIDPQFRPWRLGAVLFSAMGILALTVAAIGMYSVVAHVVSQRTNEMGIRMALGARVSDITTLVIGDGLRTVAVGIILGVLLSIILARFIASLLYGVSARDPFVIGAAAVILASIGLAASIIPALRAARVSPMEALRVD